jgi:Helix-turn-helix domain/GAF domain
MLAAIFNKLPGAASPESQMIGALRHPEATVAKTPDHIDRIYAIAEGRSAPAAYDEVSTSWQRSVNEYGIDPSSREQPRILAGTELDELREPLAKSIVDAQDELDRLYKVVGQAGYVVLLCNEKGVAVDHRGSQTEVDQFKHWGIWLGGMWSEEVEGTNGIGTCIVEQRRVTVHRDQHFRARHINLSCSAAPIFDGGGKLTAVLDVSSLDPALSERSQAFRRARCGLGALGVTPGHYLLQRRIERARDLLTSTDLSMSEIAFAAGFSDQSHFARRFRELVGVSPSAFKWSKR